MWGIWAIFFHGKSFVYVENIFLRSKFGEISPPKKKTHYLRVFLFYIILRLQQYCFTSY